ncbi:hypothetical protein ACU19_07760 [Actinobaculum suis]|uniref:DUF2207 family protein n=1 Tax=Actinobaculum suis TaxID=1657 RepID=UPI00066FECB2|nr:DUF2207 domain-containing protein [Actinobaculum suis]KMY22889.1 hypothetical protein ACU19_07760 [Actinobaculum suis]
MGAILNFLGASVYEFWIGIAICVLAVLVLACAWRPEKEYAALPRGVFPGPQSPRQTRRARSDRPPIRSTPPDMTPALADFLLDGATGDSATVATLIDLACRGYISFDFIRDTGARRETIIVSLTREADANLPAQERRFLEAIQQPGAGESAAYRQLRPMDAKTYRAEMERAGLPPSRKPILRIQGLSRKLSRRVALDVRDEVVSHFGWILRRREFLGSLGAVFFLAGIAGAVAAFVLSLVAGLAEFWTGVSIFVALCGLLTVLGYKRLSPDGVVASDQVRGFRRFLIEAPVSAGARLEDFVKYPGWARALGCLEEWTQSLERLSRTDARPIAKLVPWLVTPGEELRSWYQVRDYLQMIDLTLHGHPAAEDDDEPGGVWGVLKKFWDRVRKWFWNRDQFPATTASGKPAQLAER